MMASCSIFSINVQVHLAESAVCTTEIESCVRVRGKGEREQTAGYSCACSVLLTTCKHTHIHTFTHTYMHAPCDEYCTVCRFFIMFFFFAHISNEVIICCCCFLFVCLFFGTVVYGKPLGTSSDHV